MKNVGIYLHHYSPPLRGIIINYSKLIDVIDAKSLTLHYCKAKLYLTHSFLT